MEYLPMCEKIDLLIFAYSLANFLIDDNEDNTMRKKCVCFIIVLCLKESCHILSYLRSTDVSTVRIRDSFITHCVLYIFVFIC